MQLVRRVLRALQARKAPKGRPEGRSVRKAPQVRKAPLALRAQPELPAQQG